MSEQPYDEPPKEAALGTCLGMLAGLLGCAVLGFAAMVVWIVVLGILD